MRKLKPVFVFVIALIVCILIVVSIKSAYGQAVDQCPAGWVAKYESSAAGITISGATVTFDAETTFCVKAATKNSGIITGTSFTVNWLNNGGQIPDISHVVVYDPAGTLTPTPVITTEPPEDTETPVVTTEPPEDTSTPTPIATYEPPEGGGEELTLKLAPVSGGDHLGIFTWFVYIFYKIFGY